MDTLLESAKKLAHELQNDERFIRTQMAQTASDDDKELQDLIGDFNLKRMSINNEMAKQEKDSDKLKEMDKEIRELYDRIMSNEHMQTYQSAKAELDKLVNSMVTILTMSAQGQNPDEIQEESGCAGNCAGCAGCH